MTDGGEDMLRKLAASFRAWLDPYLNSKLLSTLQQYQGKRDQLAGLTRNQTDTTSIRSNDAADVDVRAVNAHRLFPIFHSILDQHHQSRDNGGHPNIYHTTVQTPKQGSIMYTQIGAWNG